MEIPSFIYFCATSQFKYEMAELCPSDVKCFIILISLWLVTDVHSPEYFINHYTVGKQVVKCKPTFN